MLKRGVLPRKTWLTPPPSLPFLICGPTSMYVVIPAGERYLKVRVGNVAAQKMYENLGYVVHSSSEKQGDDSSGFMVETTGENPKEVMLCVDLADRAQAPASTREAEGGSIVRIDSEERESEKQDMSSVSRDARPSPQL